MTVKLYHLAFFAQLSRCIKSQKYSALLFLFIFFSFTPFLIFSGKQMDVKNMLTYIFHLHGMKLLLYCTGQKSALIIIFPKEDDTGRIWKSGFRPASFLLPSQGKGCTFTVNVLCLCQIFMTTALCLGTSPTELHFRHLHLSAKAVRSYFSCTKQLK